MPRCHAGRFQEAGALFPEPSFWRSSALRRARHLCWIPWNEAVRLSVWVRVGRFHGPFRTSATRIRVYLDLHRATRVFISQGLGA